MLLVAADGEAGCTLSCKCLGQAVKHVLEVGGLQQKRESMVTTAAQALTCEVAQYTQSCPVNTNH